MLSCLECSKNQWLKTAFVPDLSQDAAAPLAVRRDPLRLERPQEAGQQERHRLGAVAAAVDVRAHAGEDQVGERVVAAEAGEDVRAALKSSTMKY